MKNKKILKMSYPHIETFPMYANILSILEGNGIGEQWILNNFIETYNNDTDLVFYDYNYYMCPYLNIEMISKKFLEKKDLNITDTIIENIEDNKYAYFIVNTAYIPAYRSQQGYPHDMFVYGYSNEENLFYIADCFAGGRYAYKTCTFRELEMAVSKISGDNELWFNGCLYFISLMEADYIFSHSRVVRSMQDYLQGKPVTCWNCDNLHGRSDIDKWKFGIDTYEFLNEKVSTLNVDISRANQIFTLLWDHKKQMCRIIEYLKLEKFYDDMTELMEKAKILRNLYLKYIVKRDVAILNKMHEILGALEKCERKIFPEIIVSITK